MITADGNQPPCGARSQWVTRIVRTIQTTKGKLVLHEAGLQCPQPGVGPRVYAVWALDGTHSTGIFGAHGQGTDIAYPLQDTAAPGERSSSGHKPTGETDPPQRRRAFAHGREAAPDARRGSTRSSQTAYTIDRNQRSPKPWRSK